MLVANYKKKQKKKKKDIYPRKEREVTPLGTLGPYRSEDKLPSYYGINRAMPAMSSRAPVWNAAILFFAHVMGVSKNDTF